MTYTLLWDNSTNTANTYLGNYSGGKNYRGENFTGGTDVVGHVVNQVKVNLAYYNGTITGTAYVVVVKSDLSEIEIGSIDVSTLTSTLVEYTFTNDSNTYTMQNDDMVCLKYDVTVSSSYLMSQYSTNTFTNSDYCYKSGGSWTLNESSLSGAMKIYEKEGAPSSSGVLLPPPPAMVRL